MPRKQKQTKPLVYAFWEGESEEAYLKYLKTHFEATTVIRCLPKSGLFEYAKQKLNQDMKYANQMEVTDEIWFFFDVEPKESDKWNARLKIMNSLKKLRKKPNIKIRLLMTSACIEYWFMLHYSKTYPSFTTTADRERIYEAVRRQVPSYAKGDEASIAAIANQYPTAIENGKWSLKQLEIGEDISFNSIEERDKWLYTHSKTFTTVHEAIEYLESVKSLSL